MTPDEILQEIRDGFSGKAHRRFLPGLLIAFIDFLRALGATNGRFKSLTELYEAFPKQDRTSSGSRANTLIVSKDGRNLSIRPFYNAIERWFRDEQKRFDYPSSAPHATQAWVDYEHWLSALLAYGDDELAELEARVKEFVLEALPSQDVDPATITREPPRFLLFLESFDLASQRGERSGAAYQGTVFGYMRADAPHLQVEVGKVRTGSKREKRVGDVDARDGDALVLSAEVKQFIFESQHLPDVSEFAALIAKHKALGLVVALDFADQQVKDALEKMGLRPVSKQDLVERVRLWDPLKQKIAVNALLYYVGFREQNSVLYARIKAFLDGVESAEGEEG